MKLKHICFAKNTLLIGTLLISYGLFGSSSSCDVMHNDTLTAEKATDAAAKDQDALPYTVS